MIKQVLNLHPTLLEVTCESKKETSQIQITFITCFHGQYNYKELNKLHANNYEKKQTILVNGWNEIYLGCCQKKTSK